MSGREALQVTNEEVELTYRDSTCCTAVMESLKVMGVSERRSVDALMRLRYDEACEFGTAQGNSADTEDGAEGDVGVEDEDEEVAGDQEYGFEMTRCIRKGSGEAEYGGALGSLG